MSRKTSYIIELSLGLVLTATISWTYWKKTPALESASLRTYDLVSRLRNSAPNVESIHIVEIDDESIANLGRWPWPRALVAQLVDEVASSGAKVIGLNVLFTEQDQNSGLGEVSRLRQSFSEILAAAKPQFARKRISAKPFEDFLSDLEQTQEDLDGDAILTRSIEEASNVVLPMYFQPGDPKGNNLEKLPPFFEKSMLENAKGGFENTPTSVAAVLPLETLGDAGLAVGHSNLSPDTDGTLRRVSPVMRYGASAFPSFGLEIVRTYKDLQPNAVKPAALGLSLFNLNVPLDESGSSILDLTGVAGAFPRHSAIDVLSNALPENTLRNKIVLLGVTAPGIGQTFVTPSGRTLTGLEIWAAHIENILNQHFINRPPWAVQAEWGLVGLAALIVLLALPFLRAKIAIPVFFVALIAAVGGSAFLMMKQSVWVSPTYAAALMAGGFALIIGRRLMFSEKKTEMVEAEGVETNKMLGLSFQGQGMLDLAFEKFRKCPVDDAMKELLYNLGLDMERKRQFTKAAAVFEHIASADARYKDIAEKIEVLKKAGEGAVFGGLGKKGSDATVVVDGLKQNTTLGRYEVMKELGRGAMGIVYLGRDPKINRQVAIKTLRFEDNMDDDQIKSVKERFFREAESAGNLTHPNIIRIFDAGEDQEVAYIAMELLEGEDLKKQCDKSALLPFDRTLDIVAQVASGLDYAHKQGVVHRDIKPGNIMLLKDETLRITDFGIARIQATSKTATGAVLGTPAYMSPEQVNGKKVDGRADIFSLGVTLFELLTGEKPFYADSIAALLYRIANVEHPDPREFNASVPPEIIPVLSKALAKDPAARYQSAGEMAADIVRVRQEVAARLARGEKAPADIPKAAAPARPAQTLAPAPQPAKAPEPVVLPPAAAEEKPARPPATPPLFEDTLQSTMVIEPDSGFKPELISDLEKAFNIPESGTEVPAPPADKTEEPIQLLDPFAEPGQTEPVTSQEIADDPFNAPEPTKLLSEFKNTLNLPGANDDKTIRLDSANAKPDFPMLADIEHSFQPGEPHKNGDGPEKATGTDGKP